MMHIRGLVRAAAPHRRRASHRRCFSTPTAPLLQSPRSAGGDPAAFTAEDVLARMREDKSFTKQLGTHMDQQVLTELDEATSDPADVPRPTARQISLVCLRSAIPFVGFGFFDNMVMLTVGDAIDATFGVAMGFSTMAAAGLGQCVSDATGITLQGFIERFADRLGLPNPNLTRQQEKLGYVVSWMQAARTVGIVIGCLIGMFPLLFLNTTRRMMVDVIKDTLPEEKRIEMEKALQSRKFAAGEKLLTHGEPTSEVYIIVSGEVQVVGRDNFEKPVDVCTLGPGNLVGELEAVNNHACAADVIATDEGVHVQVLSKRAFLELVDDEQRNVFHEHVTSNTDYIWYRMKHMGDAGKDPRSHAQTKADRNPRL